MPMVILYYGPYEAHGTLKHRVQRLHGLLTGLTAKRYDVEIVPSQHQNRLEVEIEGCIICQCDVRNLLFNAECEDDVVCQRTIAIIEEAVSRIYSNRNVPKFVSVTKGKRYTEKCKTLTTRDYFSSSISLLYEHQKQWREISMPIENSHKQDENEKMKWLENVPSHCSEEEDVFESDEFADWEFVTSIIRSIVELLPKEKKPAREAGRPSISFRSPLSLTRPSG